MEKPFVRLEGGTAKVKKKVADQPEQTIKLAIRLNETINETLRSMLRYRGDLSIKATEALTDIDLTSVRLISLEEKMVRDTTITLSRALHKRLKKVADERDSSMNVLVNTALAYWLASQGALKLK